MTSSHFNLKFGLVSVLLFLQLRCDSQYLYNWAKSEGGNSTDLGKVIAIDNNGNVFTTGTFQSINADFDPGPGTSTLSYNGNTDVFVSKFNASGIFQWAFSIGSPGFDEGVGLACDGAGNVIVSGNFTGSIDIDPSLAVVALSATGLSDIFICKYGPSGNLIWGYVTGSNNSETSKFICTDAAGNIYDAGVYRMVIDMDPGLGATMLSNSGTAAEIYFRKLDANGNFQWAQRVGGTGTEELIGMCLDQQGNILSTGYYGVNADFDPGPGIATLNSFSNDDAFVLKLDNAGNFIWVKQIGGTGSDNGIRVCTDAAGNVYHTGVTTAACDIDPGPGTFIISPQAPGLTIYISKLDVSGNFLWGKTFNSMGGSQPCGIEVDQSGDVITSGLFINVTDFDPGPGTYMLTTPSNGGIFMHRMDNNGNFLGVQAIIGNTVFTCYDMKLKNGYVYITGFYNATMDFDPAAPVDNLVSVGMQDIYIGKYNNCGSPPTVPAAIIGPSVACGTNVPISFSVAPVYSALSYSWNLSGGIVGTSTTNVLSTTVTGNGNISLKVLNTCGISGIITKSVTIDSTKFAVYTSSICCASICNGGGTVSVVGYTPALVNWSNASTGSVVNNLCAGVNNVIVVSALGCTVAQNCFVNSPPPLNASVAVISSTICAGNCANLSGFASGGLGAYTYTWFPGNFATASISVCPSSNSTYTLIVEDGCCNTTFQKIIYLDPCSGIDENIFLELVNVFPNPSNEYVNIEMNGHTIDEIILTNLLGQVMIRYSNIYNERFHLNTHELPKGLYSIKILSGKYTLIKQISVE